MLRYETRTHRPLVRQLEFDFNRDYNKLYELDREWFIEYEKPDKYDLRIYDRDIILHKEKQEQKKMWLIKLSQEILEDMNIIDIDNFNLSFNRYNGYKVEYNGKCFETFNYLFDDYVKKIFLN